MALAESPPLMVPPVRTRRSESDAGYNVVVLRGEPDAWTTHELSSGLAGAIARDESDIVLDMSEMRYVGAAALTVILRARAFLALRSRTLRLRSPSKLSRKVLSLCGLETLIERTNEGGGNGDVRRTQRTS